jgi:cytochrome c553
MRKGAVWLASITVLVGLIAWVAESTFTTAQAAPARPAAAKPAGAGPAARGKYLVTVMACNDCHTPWTMGANGPEPDMTRMLSGHPASATLPPPPAPNGPWVGAFTGDMTAWAGPWGISYTRNLTPDKETGLGLWTEQQFIETIRNGRKQGRGRQLLPPMPWQMYRNLNDSDLKAIFAYLKTIPAMSNNVPDPVIALPPPK